MNDKKQEESDLKINWKAFGVISIILVSVHIWGISGGYDWISEISPIYRDMDISMTGSSLNKQCENIQLEFTELKNFLGIGDLLTSEQIENISWADFQYYVKLSTQLRELDCDS